MRALRLFLAISCTVVVLWFAKFALLDWFGWRYAGGTAERPLPAPLNWPFNP